MAIDGYYLGGPAWGVKVWTGSLYSADARPREYLEQYARVFNTVEGNTTFYSVPSAETVRRWRDAVPASFRFCFKLPRQITHYQALVGTEKEVRGFFERLAPLEERLGPFMIQLPAAFGPDRLDVLDRFLASLPGEYHYAVELRHRAFFGTEAFERVNELLAARGCERVVLDTRSLRAGDPEHPELAAARHPKPNLPVQALALGKHPLLRFIAHPDEAVNHPGLEGWARHVVRWVRQEKQPYVMIHCPGDVHVPPLARWFHERLRSQLDIGEIPAWPGEEEPKGQLSLL